MTSSRENLAQAKEPINKFYLNFTFPSMDNTGDRSCPKVFSTVKSAVQSAISQERRLGASLLRLHFHDCFVNVNYHDYILIAWYT
jgi:hypothetical protein